MCYLSNPNIFREHCTVPQRRRLARMTLAEAWWGHDETATKSLGGLGQRQEEVGTRKTGTICHSPLLQAQGNASASERGSVKASHSNKNKEQVPFAMLVNSLTDGKTFFRHIRPQPLSLISAVARERTDICTNLGRIGKTMHE